jgi:serine/threonine protein kinase
MPAEFYKFSDYKGPGEEFACLTLQAGLTSDFLVVSGRPLDSANSEDIDIWVLGQNHLFVIDEKYWGPHVTMGDTKWTVRNEFGKESERSNPLGNIAHKARAARGWLDRKINAFGNVRDRRVKELIVLTYKDVYLDYEIGRNPDERVKKLPEIVDYILNLDKDKPSPEFKAHRDGVKRLLLDEKSRLRNPLPTFQGQNLKVLRKLSPDNENSAPRRVEVFEAEDQFLGDVFHLRCFVKHFFVTNESQTLEFFRREKNSSAILASTNRSWNCRHYFHDEKRNYLVFMFEKPAGVVSLSELIISEDKKLLQVYAEQTIRICMDAFLALSQVHEKKIVHRTLYPGRIWISPKFRISFNDFYASGIVGEETISSFVDDPESLPFRAAESEIEIGASTYESDVFSLAKSLKHWIEKCEKDLELARNLGPKNEINALNEILNRCQVSQIEERPKIEHVLKSIFEIAPDRFEEFESRFAARNESEEVNPEGDIFALPTLKDRYEKVAILGSGGSAITYRTRHRDDDGTFSERVVKHARSASEYERLKKEFRVLQELNGQTFATVKEITEVPSPGVLILSYVPGITLRDYYNEKLELEVVVDLFESALEKLEIIHAMGWIHGDVQGQNILVNEAPQLSVNLIDFGSAVRIGDTSKQPRTIRTCAPEMIEGLPKTESTDVYSLAATFLNLILERSHRKIGASDFKESFEVHTLSDLESSQFSGKLIKFIEILFECVNFEQGARPSILEIKSKLSELLVINEYVLTAGYIEKVNPSVDLIRSLYLTGELSSDMAIAERAYEIEELAKFTEETYVKTKLDTELLPEIIYGQTKVFLLTGNPGGGKTSFINRLREELQSDPNCKELFRSPAEWQLEAREKKFVAVLDGSASSKERSANQVVRDALLKAKNESYTAIIAINDGRTREFFREVEDQPDFFEWAQLVNDYFEQGKDHGADLQIIDLKARAYSTFKEYGILEKTIEKIVESSKWATCQECSCRSMCPIYSNKEKLKSETHVSQISKLVTFTHLRGAKRPNMRQLRSAIAFLMTGDKSCQDVHNLANNPNAAEELDELQIEKLLFEYETADDLILSIRELDPALQISPKLRQRIVSESSVARSRERFAKRYRDLSREIALGVEEDTKHEIWEDLQLYKYGAHFIDYLKEERNSLEPLLLGLSRAGGNQLNYQGGLAVTDNSDTSGWSFAKVISADKFSLKVGLHKSKYLETIPETIILTHDQSNLELSINLDLFELILRCANGEMFFDNSTAALRLSILAFERKLLRMPQREVLAISSRGSTGRIQLIDERIVLGTKELSDEL